MRVLKSKFGVLLRTSAVGLVITLHSGLGVAQSLEAAVNVLCDGGLTHFLAAEFHGHDDNMILNTAILESIISRKEKLTFCRELTVDIFHAGVGLTRKNYMNPENANTLAWLTVQGTVASRQRSFHKWEELEALPGAWRFVHAMQHRLVTRLTILPTDVSDNTLNLAIKRKGRVVISGGLSHMEGAIERGQKFKETSPGIYYRPEYQETFPWGAELAVPDEFLPLGDGVKDRFNAFGRLAGQRQVAIVRPASAWHTMVHNKMDSNETRASYTYYNGIGYAALDLMGRQGLNATILFPAEHLPAMQKRLKPGKKHIYRCDATCMGFVPGDERDEL